MEAEFHGAAVITLDAKGRVAIPTRHRAALLQSGKSLVLTAHPDGCVLIYPETDWEPVRAKVATFPSFDPTASWWKRLPFARTACTWTAHSDVVVTAA